MSRALLGAKRAKSAGVYTCFPAATSAIGGGLSPVSWAIAGADTSSASAEADTSNPLIPSPSITDVTDASHMEYQLRRIWVLRLRKRVANVDQEARYRPMNCRKLTGG